MKVSLYKIVELCLIITGLVYLAFTFLNVKYTADSIRLFIMPQMLLYYYLTNKKRNVFFYYFLVFYLIAEIVGIYNSLLFLEEEVNYMLIEVSYYVSSISFCLCYFFLLAFMMKKMTMRKVVKRFSIHLVVFFLFSVYTIYQTNFLINYEFDLIQVLIENIYNVLLVLVLSVSFINYLYHDTKNEGLLFLSCLFIVFSDFSQIAYLFLEQNFIPGILEAIFFCLGLFFMVLYIRSSTIKMIQ